MKSTWPHACIYLWKSHSLNSNSLRSAQKPLLHRLSSTNLIVNSAKCSAAWRACVVTISADDGQMVLCASSCISHSVHHLRALPTNTCGRPCHQYGDIGQSVLLPLHYTLKPRYYTFRLQPYAATFHGRRKEGERGRETKRLVGDPSQASCVDLFVMD